jgi:hypothetical protein
MSTHYYPVARPVGKAGLNGRILALVAVGAVGGFVLGGIEAPRIQIGQTAVIRTAERPAMDASMGYWDVVDTRPAVSVQQGSLEDVRAEIATLTAAARPAMPASMGHWEFTLAKPGMADTTPFDEQHELAAARPALADAVPFDAVRDAQAATEEAVAETQRPGAADPLLAIRDQPFDFRT